MARLSTPSPGDFGAISSARAGAEPTGSSAIPGLTVACYQPASTSFAAAVVCGVAVSRQSGSPGSPTLNHTSPCMEVVVKYLPSSVIHAALSPPLSAQPTSLIHTGLCGAIDPIRFSVAPNRSAGCCQWWPLSVPQL